MANFPETDVVADDLFIEVSLRLHNAELFDQLHSLGERQNSFYRLSHKAVALATEPSLDNEHLTGALLTGVKLYEVLATYAAPELSYQSDHAQNAAFVGACQFAGEIHSADDFLERANYAGQRLEQDTPQLAETIAEVSARHVNYDPVATKFALKGAGLVRAMQIFVNRRLQLAD